MTKRLLRGSGASTGSTLELLLLMLPDDRFFLTFCLLVLFNGHAVAFSRGPCGSNRRNVGCQLSLDDMNSLDEKLKDLDGAAPTALAGFYEPHLKSFSVQPGLDRISVTSTCFALQAILSSPESSSSAYDSILCMDPSVDKLNDNRTPVRSILRELLLAEWREDDMFQVPLLLHTVLVVDKKRVLLQADDAALVNAQVKKLIASVVSARPQRREGMQHRFSDYILFRCAVVYAELVEDASEKQGGLGSLPLSCIPEGAASELPLALARCAEKSSNELCRQLALRTAGDTSSFDVMRLAYSLLTYVVATQSLAGTAGRELSQGEGPSRGTKISPLNKSLVSSALAAFFAEQKENGLWDKGQPIYKSFRRTGINVGNAFVFSVDTLSSLLFWLPAELFRPHLAELRRTLAWIEFHQTVEILPDYCDPESGQCYGKALCGWSSSHFIADSGPLAWSTGQVVSCISQMRQVVEEIMHNDVLNEFRGTPYSAQEPSFEAWERLLDTDLGQAGRKTLKQVLSERMLEPLSGPSSILPSYSAILFGPPGTAKTTICTALARRIGWDFLVIDTSVFLADGLTNVAARIRYVFERLQSLRNCVILFDEIEEFCLNRDTPGLGMESRMLTTAMLTAINDLRRAEQSVFFLATNRLRAFDAAITRPGRFDLQLFVGTPNLEARTVQFSQKLADVPVDEADKEKAMDSYRNFLESVWEDEARFMNYLEGMQFAGACANIVRVGSSLTDQEMNSILQTQSAILTVRGTVREEYLASMELTRL